MKKTKTYDFGLLFLIAGILLGMYFGLNWWQAILVAFLSIFELKYTTTTTYIRR